MGSVRCSSFEYCQTSTIISTTVTLPESEGIERRKNVLVKSTCCGKPPGYKGGVTLIILATGLALAGTATPSWSVVTSQTGDITVRGLWMLCADLSMKECSAITPTNFKGFEKWMQIIVVIADLAFLASTATALKHNSVAFPKSSELLAVYGGILCCVGAVVFAVNTKNQAEVAYGLGYFLIAAASAVGVAGGVVVAIHNWAAWEKSRASGEKASENQCSRRENELNSSTTDDDAMRAENN